MKKGNTLRAVPSDQLLEKMQLIIPFETLTVFTSKMVTLVLVMRGEAVCPFGLPVAVEDHRWSLEGETHMLGKMEMETAFRFGACMSATWMIHFALYSLHLSLSYMLSQSLHLYFPF